MSTAGKVLTVLVTLALLGWIFLASLVADLNANWGQRISALQAQVEQLHTQLDEATSEIARFRRDAELEFLSKDKDLLELRTELSKLEKFESMLKETLSRYQLQMAALQTAAENERERLEYRLAERESTQAQLSQARSEVDQLKSATDSLFAQLDQLQEAFAETLESNQQLLRQLVSRAPAVGGRYAPVRPAGFRR